jgi:hypothetical protein
MGDNGKIEPGKTAEQLATERLTRYQANPESFIELNEVIACVIRNPGIGLGVATYINPNCKRLEFDIAYSELQVSMIDMALQFRVRAELPNKVVPAKGNFLNFARGKRA